jgi:hypothetical protein
VEYRLLIQSCLQGFRNSPHRSLSWLSTVLPRKLPVIPWNRLRHSHYHWNLSNSPSTVRPALPFNAIQLTRQKSIATQIEKIQISLEVSSRLVKHPEFPNSFSLELEVNSGPGLLYSRQIVVSKHGSMKVCWEKCGQNAMQILNLGTRWRRVICSHSGCLISKLRVGPIAKSK